MSVIKQCLLILSLSLLCAVATAGQNVSEKYCKQIKDSVIKKLNPTKIDREEVYSDECIFELRVAGDVDVSLSVEKLNSDEESHKSLDRLLTLLVVGNGLESEADLRYGKLDTGNFWDEVFFIRATTTNSGVLMLRKGKVAIRILSLKEAYLVRTEQLLRNRIERTQGNL